MGELLLTTGFLLTTLYLSFVRKSKIFRISSFFLAIVLYRKVEVHLKVGNCINDINQIYINS